MKLDDIHSPHSQAGTIDHTANIAIQGYIIKLPLRGMGFPGVILGWVVASLSGVG